MCGITACVGDPDALDTLIDGLENLEYRGYDSAGVAVRNGTGVRICKREGEISRLAGDIDAQLPASDLGIGHTRWSTHGAPTDANAHPHTDCGRSVAVVHNGIIDNYAALRRDLSANGHEFTSETDSEVVPHLVERYLADGHDPEAAFRRTVRHLEGSYAIAAIVEGTDAVFAARNGSPLVLGVGERAHFLASDAPAFIEHTDQVVYLKDGDVVRIDDGDYAITDQGGDPVWRDVTTVDWEPEDAMKAGYDHFMLKEIHEQPDAISRTLRGRVSEDGDRAVFDDLDVGEFGHVDSVQFVACGTSYHAAMYGRQLLMERGGAAHAYRAAEYATNPPPVTEDTLVVAVTQSGETADTLSAVRTANARGATTLGVTNVIGSTALRECDEGLLIRAGPEIGVAATKTFSSQVSALTLLVDRLIGETGVVRRDQAVDSLPLEELATLSDAFEAVLDGSRAARLAREYHTTEAFFFIGRGVCHPVALEGALKLKEISYEHAEGFPAGELKHGPLALVTPNTTVIAVFSGRDDAKTASNVREVAARGGNVVAVTDGTVDGVDALADDVLEIPETRPELSGLLANLQLQLFSYHVADTLDRAIDKPRNLAKSVTVE